MRTLTLIGLLAWATLATPPVRGVEKADIDRAIERGVKGLLTLQSGVGGWPDRVGSTALAGVTLLECDVPRSDKAIQKAAQFVRNEAINNTQVYVLATAIFFLDLLNDPVDVPLIEALTVRLLSGQVDNGGWMYDTPPIPVGEVERLQAFYKAMDGKKLSPVKKPRSPRDLDPNILLRLTQIRALPGASYAPCDHSNTQFATLALWVGRRYGVPVDIALRRVDVRFRTGQNADGGWGYHMERTPEGASTPGMTCAGILGLSVAQGMVLMTKPGSVTARTALDPKTDANLRAALAYVARFVGDPSAAQKAPVPKLKGKDIYFLWSLERILVAMDSERIGGKDWYNWGAEILLGNQETNGRWSADYAACGADTCFALLFLRRANLASDLTSLLKKDFVLKAGGSFEKPIKPSTDPKTPPKETVSTKPPIVTTPVKPSGDKTPLKPRVETRSTFTQPRSAHLAETLLKATTAKQRQLLDEMRDGRGVEYTEALAGAIPQLSGAGKSQARTALAERLTRMKADTVLRYLQDDDTEIRRAAALASGTREFKDQTPKLIALLGDTDQGVVLAAHTALKAMTGQKIGPTPEPWRAWWKKQQK